MPDTPFVAMIQVQLCRWTAAGLQTALDTGLTGEIVVTCAQQLLGAPMAGVV